ncbi:MAG: peptidylprolyl isomerase [Christensenellales bacterium]|jgi:peptidyl-prolyl cis-trans isomerase D
MSLKKGLCALLAVLCLFCLISCKLVRINKERDAAQVVAIVEGHKILKGEYLQALRSALAQYGMTEEDLDSADYASIAETFRVQVLDMVIEQKVQLIKAAELGLDQLTDEDYAAIQEDIDSLLSSMLEGQKATIAAENGTLSEEQIAEQAEIAVQAFRDENGYTDAYLHTYYTNLKIVEKVKDYLIQDVSITDDTVYSSWASKCDDAKSSYSSDPTAFVADLNDNNTIYYYNEETHRVKHILLKLSEEDISEITSLRKNEGDEAADTLREERLARLTDKLAEVQEKLGEAPDKETFDAVMQEHSEDTGLASYPDGYLLCASSTQYMPEFTKGGMALKNEGNTSVISTDYGYHILYLDKVWSMGVVPYDDIKEALRLELETEKKNETYYTAVDFWWDAMEVTTYPKRLG